MPRSMVEVHALGHHAHFPRRNCPECKKQREQSRFNVFEAQRRTFEDRTIDERRYLEEKGKSFYLLYTPAEIQAKTVELFHECPICAHCARRVKAPDHAVALHRNRDGKWLLVHEPVCAIDTIAEENDLMREAAQERRAG